MMIGGKGLKKKPEGYEEPESTDVEPEDEEEGVSMDEAKDEAAAALMRGVKLGDKAAVREAMEAFFEACSGGE